MIEPFIALGVFASVSLVNNIMRTLLTRGRHEPTRELLVKEAPIAVPLSTINKLPESSERPYQWFAEVWKLVNAGKLPELTDAILQELFTAQGKGRVAQKVFYDKYHANELPTKKPSRPIMHRRHRLH